MKPDIVGYTGFSSQAVLVKELASFAKKQLPSIVNIVGGIHATVIPLDYATDSIDIIVRGEGGTAFLEILNRFKKGMPLAFGDGVLSPRIPILPPRQRRSLPSIPRSKISPSPEEIW